LVRTSVVYYDKLRSVLDRCLRLGLVHGVITIDLLAEELRVGERVLREYLRDLMVLGVLEYLGAGRYRVNIRRINSVTNYFDRDRIEITDFFDEELVNIIRASREVEDRVDRIFSKLDIEYLLDPELRDKIRSLTVGGSDARVDGARIVGDRLIVPDIVRSFPLDDVYIGGSSYDYSLVNKILRSDIDEPFAVLTLAFISAASYVAYFSGDVLDESKSLRFLRPVFKSYDGRKPFIRGEPFYELVTSYPELLDYARNMAARLIAQKIHYEVVLDAINSSDGDIEVFFMGGSLFPHGFVLRSKKLLILKRKVERLFEKLIATAKKKNILLVGVNFRPHDNIFLRIVRNILRINISYINDTNALIFLLDDKDTTALINRFREKGREKIDQWYEFYMKIRGRVIKAEFISLGEPIKEYVKIRDYLYSSSIPSPRDETTFGPSPMIWATMKAADRLRVLSETFTKVIELRFSEHIAKISW